MEDFEEDDLLLDEGISLSALYLTKLCPQEDAVRLLQGLPEGEHKAKVSADVLRVQAVKAQREFTRVSTESPRSPLTAALCDSLPLYSDDNISRAGGHCSSSGCESADTNMSSLDHHPSCSSAAQVPIPSAVELSGPEGDCTAGNTVGNTAVLSAVAVPEPIPLSPVIVRQATGSDLGGESSAVLPYIAAQASPAESAVLGDKLEIQQQGDGAGCPDSSAGLFGLEFLHVTDADRSSVDRSTALYGQTDKGAVQVTPTSRVGSTAELTGLACDTAAASLPPPPLQPGTPTRVSAAGSAAAAAVSSPDDGAHQTATAQPDGTEALPPVQEAAQQLEAKAGDAGAEYVLIEAGDASKSQCSVPVVSDITPPVILSDDVLPADSAGTAGSAGTASAAPPAPETPSAAEAGPTAAVQPFSVTAAVKAGAAAAAQAPVEGTAPAPLQVTPAAGPAEVVRAEVAAGVGGEGVKECDRGTTECDPADEAEDSARVAAAVAKVVQWDDGGGAAGLDSPTRGGGGGGTTTGYDDCSSSAQLGGGGVTETDGDDGGVQGGPGGAPDDLDGITEGGEEGSPDSRAARRSMARSMGRSVMIEGGEGDGDADSVRMAGVLLCAEIMADSDWASDSVAPSGRASVDEPRRPPFAATPSRLAASSKTKVEEDPAVQAAEEQDSDDDGSEGPHVVAAMELIAEVMHKEPAPLVAGEILFVPNRPSAVGESDTEDETSESDSRSVTRSHKRHSSSSSCAPAAGGNTPPTAAQDTARGTAPNALGSTTLPPVLLNRAGSGALGTASTALLVHSPSARTSAAQYLAVASEGVAMAKAQVARLAAIKEMQLKVEQMVAQGMAAGSGSGGAQLAELMQKVAEMREEYSQTLNMQELLVQQQYSQVMALAVQQQEVLRDELYGRPSASGSTAGVGEPMHRVSGAGSFHAGSPRGSAGGSFAAASPRGSAGGSVTAFGGVTRTVSEAGSRMGSLALVPEEEGESVMQGMTSYTNPLARVTTSSSGVTQSPSQLSRQGSTKAEVLDQIQATLNTMKRLGTLKKLQAKADALAAMKLTRSQSMGHGVLYSRGPSMSGIPASGSSTGSTPMAMRYSVSGALGLTAAGSSLGASPLRQTSLPGTPGPSHPGLAGGHTSSLARRPSETAGGLASALAGAEYLQSDPYPDPPSPVAEEESELTTPETTPGPSPKRTPHMGSSGPSTSASSKNSPVGRPSNPGSWYVGENAVFAIPPSTVPRAVPRSESVMRGPDHSSQECGKGPLAGGHTDNVASSDSDVEQEGGREEQLEGGGHKDLAASDNVAIAAEVPGQKAAHKPLQGRLSTSTRLLEERDDAEYAAGLQQQMAALQRSLAEAEAEATTGGAADTVEATAEGLASSGPKQDLLEVSTEELEEKEQGKETKVPGSAAPQDQEKAAAMAAETTAPPAAPTDPALPASPSPTTTEAAAAAVPNDAAGCNSGADTVNAAPMHPLALDTKPVAGSVPALAPAEVVPAAAAAPDEASAEGQPAAPETQATQSDTPQSAEGSAPAPPAGAAEMLPEQAPAAIDVSKQQHSAQAEDPKAGGETTPAAAEPVPEAQPVPTAPQAAGPGLEPAQPSSAEPVAVAVATDASAPAEVSGLPAACDQEAVTAGSAQPPTSEQSEGQPRASLTGATSAPHPDSAPTAAPQEGAETAATLPSTMVTDSAPAAQPAAEGSAVAPEPVDAAPAAEPPTNAASVPHESAPALAPEAAAAASPEASSSESSGEVKHEAKVEVAAAAAAAAVAVEVQQEVTKDAPASPDTTANEHPTAASAPTAGTLDEQVFIQAEQAAPDQCAVKADVTGAEVKKTDGEENKKEDQDEEKSAGAASASHGEEAAAAAAVPDTLTPAPTTPPPPAPAKSTTPERPSLLARAKTSLPEIQPDTSGSSFTFLSPATTPRGVSRLSTMHSLGSSGSKGASRDVASAAAEQGPRVVLVAEPVTPEAPTSGTATGSNSRSITQSSGGAFPPATTAHGSHSYTMGVTQAKQAAMRAMMKELTELRAKVIAKRASDKAKGGASGATSAATSAPTSPKGAPAAASAAALSAAAGPAGAGAAASVPAPFASTTSGGGGAVRLPRPPSSNSLPGLPTGSALPSANHSICASPRVSLDELRATALRLVADQKEKEARAAAAAAAAAAGGGGGVSITVAPAPGQMMPQVPSAKTSNSGTTAAGLTGVTASGAALMPGGILPLTSSAAAAPVVGGNEISPFSVIPRISGGGGPPQLGSFMLNTTGPAAAAITAGLPHSPYPSVRPSTSGAVALVGALSPRGSATASVDALRAQAMALLSRSSSSVPASTVGLSTTVSTAVPAASQPLAPAPTLQIPAAGLSGTASYEPSLAVSAATTPRGSAVQSGVPGTTGVPLGTRLSASGTSPLAHTLSLPLAIPGNSAAPTPTLTSPTGAAAAAFRPSISGITPPLAAAAAAAAPLATTLSMPVGGPAKGGALPLLSTPASRVASTSGAGSTAVVPNVPPVTVGSPGASSSSQLLELRRLLLEAKTTKAAGLMRSSSSGLSNMGTNSSPHSGTPTATAASGSPLMGTAGAAIAAAPTSSRTAPSQSGANSATFPIVVGSPPAAQSPLLRSSSSALPGGPPAPATPSASAPQLAARASDPVASLRAQALALLAGAGGSGTGSVPAPKAPVPESLKFIPMGPDDEPWSHKDI